MKNILFILKDDLKKLFRNPASLIVIAALCFLPSLYAWFNIWASWDPYGNTEGIEIAVTSEDEGANIEGEDINIGDEVLTNLAKNDSLGWKFMSRKKSLDGVERGDYYAAIVIPKDFSEDMISVLDKEIKKPHIDYYINEKVNAISPKVTDKGATTIVDNIEENFVGETNEVVLTVFDDIGVELGDNHVDIEKVRDGILDLEEHLPEVYADIGKLEDDMDLADGAMDSMNKSLDKADDLHDRATDLNSNLVNRLDDNKASAKETIKSVTKHLRTAQTSFQEVPELTRKASKKGDNLDQLISKLREKQDDLDSASAKMQEVANFIEDADSDIKNSTKIGDIQNSLDKNQRDLNSLKDNINDIRSNLESGDNPAVDAIEGASDQVDKVSSNVDGLFEDYNQVIQPQIELALNEFDALSDTMDDFFTHANSRTNDNLKNVQELRKQAGDLDTDQAKERLAGISTNLDMDLARVKSIMGMLDVANQVEDSPAITELIGVFENIESNIEGVQLAVDNASQAIDKGEEVGGKTFDQLEDSLTNVGSLIQDGQNRFDKKTVDALRQGQNVVKDLDNRMDERFSSLQDLRNELDGTLNELDKVAKNPSIATGALKRGEKGIDKATGAMNSLNGDLGNVQQVIDNVNITKELSGIHDLQDRLQDGKSSINSVITQIKEAKTDGGEALERIDRQAARIDDSLENMIDFVNGDLERKYEQGIDDAKLALNGITTVLDDVDDKIPEVRNVLGQVDDELGVGKEKLDMIDEKFPEVSDAVGNAADKIRELEKEGNLDDLIDFLRNDPERLSEFISDPVELDEKRLFPIPNYGSAMNPFYTTLSFWVGGLLLVSSLLVDRKDKWRFRSSETYLSRLMIFGTIGIIQAFIATLGNLFILGTYVADKLPYVLFGMLIGLVFVSIVYTLVSVFGNVGKVMAIILLVIQIGGSGGTFPIQMAPAFFQKIHAFLPFTHGIELLRESVGGIIWSVAWMRIGFLLLYLVGSIVFGLVAKKFFNKSSDKFMEKAEESGFIL